MSSRVSRCSHMLLPWYTRSSQVHEAAQRSVSAALPLFFELVQRSELLDKEESARLQKLRAAPNLDATATLLVGELCTRTRWQRRWRRLRTLLRMAPPTQDLPIALTSADVPKLLAAASERDGHLSPLYSALESEAAAGALLAG